MPQMSPLMWVSLNIYFIIIFYFVFVLIFFFNSFKLGFKEFKLIDLVKFSFMW